MAAFAIALLVVASAVLAFRHGEQRGIHQLKVDANHRLDLFAAAVQGVVKSLENVPATIQLHPAILALLREPATPQRTAAANAYLRRLNAHVGSLAAFTLDDRGVVVASSNETHPDDSRLGTDVSFRPYFLEALSGRVGRHFAIGVDGRRPGYFVSYPIRDGSVIVGVAAIKISLQPIHQTWDMVGSPALIADVNRVVIDSSNPGWRYRSLMPLTVDQRVDHQLTRVYADMAIRQFPLVAELDPQQDTQPVAGQLVLSRPLDGMDWHVMLFLDLKGVRRQALLQAALVAGFLVLFALVLAQARRISRQRSDVRRMLENANAELETKVEARTQSLRATQSELVQAAKMAVLGQLAAGITHELAQPLGALQTFAGNAEEFMRRGETEQVAGNLQIMARLADQMGNIIHPLKTFARKSDAVCESTDIGQTLSNALFLYGMRLRKMGARLVNDCAPGTVYAWCEANRLEQVLINLIGNALDAMAGVAAPCLELRVSRVEDGEAGGAWTCIDVCDNGTGIAPGIREQLFEPFFTTKAQGAGLGLGLAISRDIVSDFGGDIVVLEHACGGTCFRVRIPSEQLLEHAHH
ncbi:sensor histidine kinase [Ramlibacter sp. G-1-2-2]|uniref:C4-dicarboxylate transport sensor protein DctB n=1 Tax=Ramlibacter agri TaxID=2728837 RepID=A0A848HAB0_9BURK|nr:ATP-binding protein [Ramlibacter agri]NML47414.1 sensor histidine kinase [Ramlibacter agri]